jgi:hypothetical protein
MDPMMMGSPLALPSVAAADGEADLLHPANAASNANVNKIAHVLFIVFLQK